MSTLETIAASGRVRWGFIGAGDVTEVKSGPAFSLVPHSSVSVIARRDANKARDYAERHGVPRWTTVASEVVEADDVDAIYVATPPSSHAEYVKLAAAAGKPVYVEKPMARTTAEGEAMVRACQAAGVPLFVAYYRRALPHHEFVRRLLQAGDLGEPKQVQLTLSWPAPSGPEWAGWRWDPEVAGNGLLLDLGSHAFDLLDHWLGPLADVRGHTATQLSWADVADQVVGAFRLANDALGTANFDFAAARMQDRVTVTLSHGSVSVPVFADEAVLVSDANGKVSEHHIEHPKHVQQPLIAAIVAELLGSDEPSPSTGVSALRTQRVLDALQGEPPA